MNTTSNKRLDYIDQIKALACILVAVGHFFMSMNASNIYPFNGVTNWFIDTIYTFHVQLFFLCSGMLYYYSIKKQKHFDYTTNLLKKFVSLAVPYFTFTALTLLLKIIAENSVNTKSDGFLYTLFINPTAPYWYLYVLFFLFVFIPPIISKKSIVLLLVASVILKLIMVFNLLSELELPYFLQGVMNNAIWFILGMLIFAFEYKPRKMHLIFSIVGLAVFTVLSIIKSSLSIINSQFINFILGIIAVTSITTFFINIKIKNGFILKIFIKYNFYIYLMHTIFAAGIRIILIKLGINSYFVHIPLGLIFTFAGPVIGGLIMKKTRVLDFFVYPTKFIKFPERRK